MRTSAVLNDLIDTIKPGDGQEISRLYLVGGKIDEMRSSFLPSEPCASLNEVNVQLLLVFWWLGSKEGDLGVCS